MTKGLELIAAERARQISSGILKKDQEKSNLAYAAAVYTIPLDDREEMIKFWPWETEDYKTCPSRIRELVKAGALITTEIDRLLEEK